MAHTNSDTVQEEDDDRESVVIDNGSYQLRAGIAGEDAPRAVFENAFCSKMEDKQRKLCFGEKVRTHRYDQDTQTKHPVRFGVVERWDDMEKIWNYTFSEKLRISPKEHNILITECAFNAKANREKSTQILFETFNFKAQFICIASVLALYSSGRTSGLVIDCGYQQTQLVPIWEGYALSHATKKYNIGGYHATKYLQYQLVKNNEQQAKFDINMDVVNDIKHAHGYISEKGAADELKKPLCKQPSWLLPAYLRSIDTNYCEYTAMEIEKYCDQYVGDKTDFMRTPKEYILPDGNVVELQGEEFISTEVLFDSNIDGFECNESCNITELIIASYRGAGIDIRNDLLVNTVLAGAGSLLNGFKERLLSEIKNCSSGNINVEKVKICEQPDLERQHSSWIGGSILASLSTFGQMWITEEEYSSAGPGIVHRKCF